MKKKQRKKYFYFKKFIQKIKKYKIKKNEKSKLIIKIKLKICPAKIQLFYLQDGASDAEIVMMRTEFRAYGQF